jgi:hypothetical protein
VRIVSAGRTCGLSLTALVVLSACASTFADPTATALPPTPASTSGLTSVTPAAVPIEPSGEPASEAASPDPAFDYGFVIDITPTGFQPNVLVADCCHAVTWINLTNKANAVAFTVELPKSPLIPPGGSWTWTPPNVESVAYHSITYPSMTGVLQVNQITN